jgi:hypothetical protein
VDCVNHWETGLCEVNSWLLPFLAYPLRTRCLQRPVTANARRVPHVDCVTIWDCEASAINAGFCALLSLLFFSRLSGSNRTPRSRCAFAQFRPTKTCWPVNLPELPSRERLRVFAPCAYQASRCSSVRNSSALQVFEALPKIARERRWAIVRGSFGTTYLRQHCRPLRI